MNGCLKNHSIIQMKIELRHSEKRSDEGIFYNVLK